METFIAYADYTASNANELSLTDGHVVVVMNRENQDWWYGRNKNDGKEVSSS